MSRRERISDFTRVEPRASESRAPVRSMPRSPSQITPGISKEVRKETLTDIKRTAVRVKPTKPRQNKSNVLRRQGLKKLPPFVPRKVKKRFPAKLSIGVMVGAFSLIIVGSVIGSLQKNSKDIDIPAVQAATDTQASLSPDELLEKEPTQAEHNAHTVAKESPRYLRSPKLVMDARVVTLPIMMQDKGIPDTTNIFDVGWYEGSNLPNTTGASLMVGYVASLNKEGVFYKIGSLRAGDLLELELGNGSKIKYKVVKTKTYAPESVDMNELLVSAVPEKQGLNLITISKRFDVRTQKYENRFAVFAVRE